MINRYREKIISESKITNLHCSVLRTGKANTVNCQIIALDHPDRFIFTVRQRVIIVSDFVFPSISKGQAENNEVFASIHQLRGPHRQLIVLLHPKSEVTDRNRISMNPQTPLGVALSDRALSPRKFGKRYRIHLTHEMLLKIADIEDQAVPPDRSSRIQISREHS